jgi:hypothetical protein
MLNPVSTLRTPGLLARIASAMRNFRLPALLLAVCALFCLSACLSEPGLLPGESQRDKDSIRVADSLRARATDSIHVADSLKALPLVFAITSDYKTGNYSVHGLDSNYTKTTLDPIHSDAAVRYPGGDDIFIINKLGRDNLQLVDRHHLKTVLQIPLPPKSNPHDVALKDGLIYVAYYARAEIGIYRQSDGTAAGVIDISAYADTADHLPETEALAFVNGDLYALLQNLDTKSYLPLTAQLLKIDVAAKTVKKALALPFGNPSGMAWDAASGNLFISCLGEYTYPDYSVKSDGGIVAVSASTLELKDTLALEKDLGGNVGGGLIHNGKLILSVGTGMSDDIIAISLADGTSREIVKLGGYTTGGLAIDGPSSTLCVGDRKKGGPGLRLFDLATWKEKSAPGINLGSLPPSSLAIVR